MQRYHFLQRGGVSQYKMQEVQAHSEHPIAQRQTNLYDRKRKSLFKARIQLLTNNHKTCSEIYAMV